MKRPKRSVLEICQQFDRMSVKPYDPIFGGEQRTGEVLPPIESILAANKDMEPFVIQNASMRSEFLGNDYLPLQFVHCSDMHAIPELWNRMVQFINHYREYLSFGLHTGDFCGGAQEEYHDMYAEAEPCVHPILNCVGNHDCYARSIKAQTDKKTTHDLIFRHTADWDVHFMETEHAMTYYKDFPESNVRLIVLDQYYHVQAQTAWLRDVLSEADKQGYHVITAMHEPSAEICSKLSVTFQTLTDFAPGRTCAFEAVIADFIAKGGRHICNLAGHTHADYFGYTAAGVLNVVVECGSDWAAWSDGVRVRGTRTFDCFNVVGVNVNAGILKLIRIGNNADYFLREKRLLCYDYLNKQVIFNG